MGPFRESYYTETDSINLAAVHFMDIRSLYVVRSRKSEVSHQVMVSLKNWHLWK